MIQAIIVAAGQGKRFLKETFRDTRKKSIVPKQFLSIGHKPVYIHSIERLSLIEQINGFIIVTRTEWLQRVEDDVVQFNLNKVEKVIPGGDERQDSVWEGLCSLPRETDFVLIHDGVRPFPPLDATQRAIEIAREKGAVILAQPPTDTVKITDTAITPDRNHVQIKQTVERSLVWLAQTPQVFSLPLIRNAYEYIRERQIQVTDEAQALELIKTPVYIVPGSPENLKITHPSDLTFAEKILQEGL